MANYTGKNAAGTVTYFSASGAGTDPDPLIPDRSLMPRASGGCTPFRRICDATENIASIKASAGQLYEWTISNAHASAIRWVKIYDDDTPASTDTPKRTFMIPALSVVSGSAENGIAFGTAIGMRCVTGIADTDTTAPGANEVVVNLSYK